MVTASDMLKRRLQNLCGLRLLTRVTTAQESKCWQAPLRLCDGYHQDRTTPLSMDLLALNCSPRTDMKRLAPRQLRLDATGDLNRHLERFLHSVEDPQVKWRGGSLLRSHHTHLFAVFQLQQQLVVTHRMEGQISSRFCATASTYAAQSSGGRGGSAAGCSRERQREMVHMSCDQLRTHRV